MDLKQALKSIEGKAQTASSAKPGVAMPKAPLIEVFHSVQGEGRFVGVPMAFVRLATCPLRCLYCDTPNSYEAPPRLPVRTGVRELHEPNPVAADRAASAGKDAAAVARALPSVVVPPAHAHASTNLARLRAAAAALSVSTTSTTGRA